MDSDDEALQAIRNVGTDGPARLLPSRTRAEQAQAMREKDGGI